MAFESKNGPQDQIQLQVHFHKKSARKCRHHNIQFVCVGSDQKRQILRNLEQDHFYGHAEESAVQAKQILRRLKFDNDTIDKVSRLVRYHTYHLRRDKKIIRRCMNKIGEELFEDLLEVMRADTMAKSSYKQKERLEDIIEIKKLYNDFLVSYPTRDSILADLEFLYL